MDLELLKFQNKKLGQRLQTQSLIEADLRQRIEQLEKKQTSAESIAYVINRYWNQLNEELRVLLQRFDGETLDEQENSNENAATTSFVLQLSNWDKDELEENLQQRVQGSMRAVGKLLQAFDRIVQRNNKIASALKDEGSGDILTESVRLANIELQKENQSLNALSTSLSEKHHKMSLMYSDMKDSVEALEARNDELKLRIDDLEFELNRTRSRERRLEDQLQEARGKMRDCTTSDFENNDPSGSSIVSVVSIPGKSRADISQEKLEDLHKKVEEYKELSNKRLTELELLNNQHKEALKTVEKLKFDLQCLPESVIVETSEYKCLQSHYSVLYNESMQLKTQLEETISNMNQAKNAHLRQIEHMESKELAMQTQLGEESISLEVQLSQVRKEYEMLRIEFEQLYAANEQTGPISKEMRTLLTNLQSFNQQLKGEVTRYKKRYKEANGEIARLKHQLEQKNNCQIPISSSNATSAPAVAGSTSTSTTTPVKQESVESSCETPAKRQRLDSGSSLQDIVIKEEKRENDCCFGGGSGDSSGEPILDGISSSGNSHRNHLVKKEPAEVNSHHQTTSSFSSSSSSSSNVTAVAATVGPAVASSATASTTNNSTPMSSSNSGGGSSHERIEYRIGSKIVDADYVIRDLKNQLKARTEQYKELKALHDSFKNLTREQRDRAMLMASEKRHRGEIEELRKQCAKMECELRRRRPGCDDDVTAAREIQRLKETISQLQKNLAAQKQEDEVLLNDMEVTGNAFEEMKDMNVRLIQQLKEKDEANFKLMSERIKSQQRQKLLKEEKEGLTEQVIALNSQVEAQNQVVRKLEEKERLLQNNLLTIEKELDLKQQAMEAHRRKAIEASQSAADLKLHLDKYLAQLKEAQSSVADKTARFQDEAFKNQRLQEELVTWKRKYERAKKFELANTADEVLQEEIREYKTQLTCPSCKTNRKDAVLTKCFHVFCYECLKTRYETRQRKCPKCNAPFGANDFHRLYLA